MKLKSLFSASLLSISVQAAFAGEAVFYITEDGQPLDSMAVSVDGKKKLIASNGFVTFDIEAGEHQVELSEMGEWAGEFSFNVNDVESAEIKVDMIAGEAMPEIAIYDPTDTAHQSLGAVSGVLSAEEPGGTVDGAVITAEGTQFSTTTDTHGEYTLELPRGEYTLNIAHPNYGKHTARHVVVMANSATGLNINMSLSGDGGIEEVVAIGTYTPSSATASERDSSGVLDAIGAEQLARFGDTDAASAVKRIAGVTIAEGKYVIVRGLNPRHSSVMFNGASLPSPDPTRRIVPIDIFPANLISGIEVQKTFIPNVYADSTGGTIKLNSKSFPDEFEGKFSVSMGYRDGITGESEMLQESEALDIVGFGSGGDRELPGDILANNDALANKPGTGIMAPAQRTALTSQLSDNMGLEEQTVLPNFSMELGLGDTFYEGDRVTLGYNTSIKYKNKWLSELDGHRNTYSPVGGGEIVEDDDYDYTRVTNNIDLGAGLTLGMVIDGNHEINNHLLWLRQSSAITENIDGARYGDQDRAVLKTRLSWFEREFIIAQLEGKSRFDFLDTLLDWQMSFSQATLDSPDERTYQFDDLAGDGVYTLGLSSVSRDYTELTDENVDVGFSIDSSLFNNDSSELRMKLGFSGFSRERENKVIRLSYGSDELTGDGSSLPDKYDGVTDINAIINDGSIEAGEFFISTGTTANSDEYDATWDLNASFLMLDYNLFDIFRVELGARAEDSKMLVNTFKFGSSTPVVAQVDDHDIFPSVNATIPLYDAFQLRLAYYETKNRPDFRELAESQYIDPVTGEAFRGNSDLVSADVENMDIRAEYYFSETESISLAYFTKAFDNPIEKTLTTGGSVFTFDNGIQGEVDGIELDFKKDFDVGSYGMFVSGNFALLDSEVDIVVDTELRNQKMQGQPDSVWNLQFGLDDYDNALEYTLVFYHRGEAVYSVAAKDLPNIMIEPRSDLAFNMAYGVTEDSKLKLKMSNILDDKVQLTQGGENFRSFRKGMELELGYSMSF